MLEVRLIGKFDIKCDNKSVTLSSRAAQSLFAYLMLTVGTLHRREKLAGMFWPDESELKARTYLRNELWRIRKAIPQTSKVEYLLADNLTVGFNQSCVYSLDVAWLKNLSHTDSAEELIQALSNYQGELLPGFYEDWVILEREHLQILFEKRLALLLEILEREQRWNDILEWAERWISLGQAPEAAFRALMVAYDAQGEHAKVTSTYERCKQALRQLDLEPSEETRALAFKRNPKINIPIPLTSFIGREKELKELAELLSKSRLVTLTGSGGVGKTRLAIQIVADVLERFPDGVWFLDLAPLSNPALVASALINALGLRESPELSANNLLVNYFRSRTALVIFDNCEHLIESCSQLINSLLAPCEKLSILATSRETLRVSGEIAYRVPSLEIPKSNMEPSVDTFSKIESVQLFIERATLASPRFAVSSHDMVLIAQIVQRLDGIPLAIELAAARINVLSVEQILSHLDDRFKLLTNGLRSALPRHQTLRALIEWSYDLLSEKEQLLFRRLAVFVGGWTLEGAEQVCAGSSIESDDVLDLLSQLVNKSLVLVEASDRGNRYDGLETIRQFAREKLIESGEEENSRTKHLKYFLVLSEEAELGLRGPEGKEWHARLKDERDNIRAALKWADNTNVEAGLHISGRLHDFWESYDLHEGKRWLARFVQRPESKTYLHARAKALGALGDLLYDFRQLVEAQSLMLESLDLYRACNDKPGEVFALLRLAWVVDDQGDRKQSLELTEQALALSQALGDMWREASALSNLGKLRPPELENRVGYWEGVIDLFRKAGDWQALADHLGELGLELVLDGDMESAKKYLDESTLLLQWLNTKAQWMPAKIAYSEIALLQGDYEQARTLLEEIMLTTRELGGQRYYFWTQIRMGYLALHEGNFTEARNIFDESIQIFQMDGVGDDLIFTLEGVASLFIAVGKLEYASRLFGWADATRQKDSYMRPRIEQANVDHDIRVIIAKIGKAAFEEAYETGRGMRLDEAIALALEEASV